MTDAALRRVVRREMHSSRTTATVIVLILVALAAVYVGVEAVLRLVGSGPLLVTPEAVWAWVQDLPGQAQGPVVLGGVVIALAGVLLLWLALSPGRQPRHELGSASYAVIADNGVIASAVADRMRRELDLAKDAVVVGVGHRGADISVRPEPGQSIDKSLARSIAEAELGEYRLMPSLKVRVRIVRTKEEEKSG